MDVLFNRRSEYRVLYTNGQPKRVRTSKGNMKRLVANAGSPIVSIAENNANFTVLWSASGSNVCNVMSVPKVKDLLVTVSITNNALMVHGASRKILLNGDHGICNEGCDILIGVLKILNPKTILMLKNLSKLRMSKNIHKVLIESGNWKNEVGVGDIYTRVENVQGE